MSTAVTLTKRPVDLERFLLANRPVVLPTFSHAKDAWLVFRLMSGYAAYANLFAAPDANQKMAKNAVPARSLCFAQDTTSGVANTCRNATPGCRAACVAQNGHGGRTSVQAARALRVRFAMANPGAFLALMLEECTRLAKRGERVRLNAFSDIAWERVLPELAAVPGLQAYDYTKRWERSSLPWYRLTFSASERTADEAIDAKLAGGESVAIVYPYEERGAVAKTFRGFRVFDGDKSDDRWVSTGRNRRRGVVVALFAKGRMRHDATGFVRSLAA